MNHHALSEDFLAGLSIGGPLEVDLVKSLAQSWRKLWSNPFDGFT